MDNNDSAARLRFESFKLGNPCPTSAPAAHRRSHSRNQSVLSSSIFPPKSTSSHDISSFSFPAQPIAPSTLPTSVSAPPSSSSTPTSLSFNNSSTSGPVPSTKRNSHHSRRSSVSTRRESAELMGVTLPDLPPAAIEDNINLGEKDSIRRRALWALEGKPDRSVATVEIPELVEKLDMFEFPTKPSFPLGFGTGGKRDSFKLLATSGSSKDQLHTLIEEEEEDTKTYETSPQDSLPSPAPSEKDVAVSQHPVSAEISPDQEPVVTTLPLLNQNALPRPAASARHRPANLNLRPLSLTPDNLITTAAQSLPTPSLTPSPRPGLRALSLSSTPESISVSRHSLSDYAEDSPSFSDETKPSRRSSISYRRSELPTPELTPTFSENRSSLSNTERSSRRHSVADSTSSTSSSGFFWRNGSRAKRGVLNDNNINNNNTGSGAEQFFLADAPKRPLSASEQHFLVKSHNALLARITDLERTLTMRRSPSTSSTFYGQGSRPTSMASDYSRAGSDISDTSSGPSDEMLRLIADLKAERDELKRDVDGWRVRVGDAERHAEVLARRIDVERREAWVARSKVGMLELEKHVWDDERRVLLGERGALETKKETLVSENQNLRMRIGTLEGEKRALEQQLENLTKNFRTASEQVESAHKNTQELENIRRGLDDEIARMREEIRSMTEGDALATPTPRATSFSINTRPSALYRASRPRGLGFTSVDSESSSTDVELESPDNLGMFGFPLKVVEEVEEDGQDNDIPVFDDSGFEDEEYDNGLAGYEDEEDSDISFRSSSSFDSNDSVHNFPRAAVASPVTSSQAIPAPSQDNSSSRHVSHTSLSSWTFPTSSMTSKPVDTEQSEEDGIDKFFGCLDDSEGSDVNFPSSPSAYTLESSKRLFANGFKYAPADDDMSFFVPHVMLGMPEDQEEVVDARLLDGRRLSVVAEEEDEQSEEEVEDDSDMFGDIGGIKITFTPPQDEEDEKFMSRETFETYDENVVPRSPISQLDTEEDRSLDTATEIQPSSTPHSELAISQTGMITPPSSLPRRPTSPAPTSPPKYDRVSSPSSIPRIVSINKPKSISKSASSSQPESDSVVASTPPRMNIIYSTPSANETQFTTKFSSSVYVTPPTKRGGAMPSFIPQPVTSPSPIRSSSGGKSKVLPTATFIRASPLQPKRMNGVGSRVGHGSSGTRTGNDVDAESEIDSLENTGVDPHLHFEDANSFTSQTLDEQREHEHKHEKKPAPAQSPTRSPSSFMSLMSSPLSTQLFSSFMPLSWSAPQPNVTLPAAQMDKHKDLPRIISNRNVPPKPVYVSRELQLEKLRRRMRKDNCINVEGLACCGCERNLVLL